MDKKFVKKILAVVLGITLIAMIFSVVSLIIAAVGVSDLEALGNSIDELALLKWQSVALVCIIVPTLACYAFAFFGNGKIFNIVSAALSLLVAVTSLAFFIVLRKAALNSVSSTTYATVATSFTEFIKVAVFATIALVYFILNSVASFKKKTDKAEITEEANGNEEI
ncbi:MAG: hypothetical protein K2N47_02835 [Clostridia bacterium]|nr:hypothetical protein [Clostridia bacterium]